MNQNSKNSNESGNVIFYILIAIALLGALSFAIGQGSRSSVQSLTDDRVNLMATEIIDYAGTMKKTVAMLRLRGTGFDELSFAHLDLHANYGTYNTDAANEIFNPGGGALIYNAPNSQAVDVANTDYEFYASHEIEDIGTTCGAAGCSDLVMILPDMAQAVCTAINDRLSVNNPGGNPPVDTEFTRAAADYFAGSASYEETVGDEAGSADLSALSAGCFYSTNSTEYIFYQVLWPR